MIKMQKCMNVAFVYYKITKITKNTELIIIFYFEKLLTPFFS